MLCIKLLRDVVESLLQIGVKVLPIAINLGHGVEVLEPGLRILVFLLNLCRAL